MPQYATNPQTGERVVLVGGRWVPVPPRAAFAAPAEAPPEPKGAFSRFVTDPLKRGAAAAQQSAAVAGGAFGVITPETAAEYLASGERRSREAARSPEDEAAMASITEAPTLLEGAKAAFRNPAALVQLGVESLPQSAPALILGALGAVGGPVGVAAGVGAGSYAAEYASSLAEVIRAAGANPEDPEAVKLALTDQNIMAQARERALRRSVPVAAFDALSGGLAGRLVGKATGVGSFAARSAGELGLQAGAGAAGEALAQRQVGEYRPGEIVAEAAAEGPSAIIETAIGAASRRGQPAVAPGVGAPAAAPADPEEAELAAIGALPDEQAIPAIREKFGVNVPKAKKALAVIRGATPDNVPETSPDIRGSGQINLEGQQNQSVTNSPDARNIADKPADLADQPPVDATGQSQSQAIAAKAKANTLAMLRGQWTPIRADEDLNSPIVGYINEETGEQRTVEEHRAAIATPLSGLEPVLPEPEVIAEQVAGARDQATAEEPEAGGQKSDSAEPVPEVPTPEPVLQPSASEPPAVELGVKQVRSEPAPPAMPADTGPVPFSPNAIDTETGRPVQVSVNGPVRTVLYPDGTTRQERAAKGAERYGPIGPRDDAGKMGVLGQELAQAGAEPEGEAPGEVAGAEQLLPPVAPDGSGGQSSVPGGLPGNAGQPDSPDVPADLSSPTEVADGDRAAENSFLVKESEKPAIFAGQDGSRKVYNLMVPADAPGGANNLASMEVVVFGDEARIETIASLTNMFDSSKQPHTVGPRQMIRIAAAIAKDNPNVKFLSGDRMSGIRFGGKMLDRQRGQEVRIPIEPLLKRGGDVPVVERAGLDAYLKGAADGDRPQGTPDRQPGVGAPPAEAGATGVLETGTAGGEADAAGGVAPKKSWLDSLDEGNRQSLFATMRDMGKKLDSLYEGATRLTPQAGMTGVGAADFDEALRAEALRATLTAIRNGATPEDAATQAKVAAREAIARHNSKRANDIWWQRSEGTADAEIDGYVMRLARAANAQQQAPSPAAPAPSKSEPEADGTLRGDDEAAAAAIMAKATAQRQEREVSLGRDPDRFIPADPKPAIKPAAKAEPAKPQAPANLASTPDKDWRPKSATDARNAVLRQIEEAKKLPQVKNGGALREWRQARDAAREEGAKQRDRGYTKRQIEAGVGPGPAYRAGWDAAAKGASRAPGLKVREQDAEAGFLDAKAWMKERPEPAASETVTILAFDQTGARTRFEVNLDPDALAKFAKNWEQLPSKSLGTYKRQVTGAAAKKRVLVSEPELQSAAETLAANADTMTADEAVERAVEDAALSLESELAAAAGDEAYDPLAADPDGTGEARPGGEAPQAGDVAEGDRGQPADEGAASGDQPGAAGGKLAEPTLAELYAERNAYEDRGQEPPDSLHRRIEALEDAQPPKAWTFSGKTRKGGRTSFSVQARTRREALSLGEAQFREMFKESPADPLAVESTPAPAEVEAPPQKTRRRVAKLQTAALAAGEPKDERQGDIEGRFQTLSPTRLRMGVDRLVAAADTMSSWRDWYERHAAVLGRVFGDDAPLFQELLSATSQATGVKGNVALALKAYQQLKRGDPFTGYLPAVIKNLERVRSEQALAGRKISAYGEANTGNEDAVAVDRHIALLLFDTRKPTSGQITKAQATLRKVAAKLGWQPRQVQAALWAFNQVRMGSNPEQVQSYDTILEARADEIAAIRAAFDDAGGARAGLPGRGEAGQGAQEGTGRLQAGVASTPPTVAETVRLASNVIAGNLPDAEWGRIRDEVAADLRGLVQRLAGDRARLGVFDSIRGVNREGETFAIGGAQVRDLVAVSLLDGERVRPRDEIEATVRHEVVHLLKEAGVIPAPAWAALEAKAPEWRRMLGIDADPGYSSLPLAARNEEAIAEAYARYQRGTLKIGGAPAAGFRWMKRFLDGLRGIVAKALGLPKLPTPQEVFEAIERGDFAGSGADGMTEINGVPVAGYKTNKLGGAMQIRAYHGSPHTFDRFDLSKIGTGEGNQAFGYGMYFAENQDVAKSYQPLADNFRAKLIYGGKPYDDQLLADEMLILASDKVQADEAAQAGFRKAFEDRATRDLLAPASALNQNDPFDAGYLEARDILKSDGVGKESKPDGSLYTVSLDVEPDDLLDWDAPLSQQPEKVRKALEGVGFDGGEYTVRVAGDDLNDQFMFTSRKEAEAEAERWRQMGGFDVEVFDDPLDLPGADIYRKLEDRARQNGEVSNRLRAAGIPGIRYLDGGSRAGGEGTRNFVIFDDSLIQIEARLQTTTLAAGAMLRDMNLADTIDDLHQGSVDGIERSMRPGMRGKAGAQWDRLRRRFQDRFLFVRRRQEIAERMVGRPLTEAEDIYLAEELHYGRIDEGKFRDDKDFREPIMEAMQDNGLNVDQVDDFLTARHAEERNAAVAEINPKFPDGGSGMFNDDAQRILGGFDLARGKDFSAEQIAALQRIGDLVDQMMERRATRMVESGVWSSAQADAYRTKYKHYVPQRGIAADPDEEIENALRPIQGKGFMGSSKREKRAMGRSTRAPDVLATAFTLADESVVRGAKNQVGQALLNLAQSAPDPNVWSVDPIEREAYMVKLKDGRQQVRYLYRPTVMSDDLVKVWVDGRQFRVQLKDQDLLRAMSRLGGGELDDVLAAAGKVNGVLSRLNTMWSPVFMVTNAMVDLQTALINLGQFDQKGLRREVAGSWLKAARGAIHYLNTGKTDTEWAAWAQEFRENGGQTAFNQIGDVETQTKKIEEAIAGFKGGNVAKAKQGIGTLFKFLVETPNTGIDNAVRLSAYVALRKRGFTPSKAASAAKNLTTNFNRKGELGPAINALFMFFNASVQGTATVGKAILTSPTVRKWVAGAIVLGAAQEILGGMWDPPDDDEDGLGLSNYDRIPEWQKQSRIIIPYGPDPGDHYMIPLPYVYGFFHSLGQATAAYLRGAKDELGKPVSLAKTIVKLATAFERNIVPPGLGSDFLVPSVAQPFVEIWKNEDYFGRPIAPTKFPGDDKPDSQTYYPGAPKPAVYAAQFLNSVTGGDTFRPGLVDVSPESLAHITSTYAGAAGSLALNTFKTLSNAAYEAAGGNREDPKLSVASIPLVNKFVGTNSPWQAQDVTYQRLAEIEILADEAKGTDDRAKAVRQENRRLLALTDEARKLRREMSKLRKERRRILDDDSIPDAESRKRTDRLDARQRDLMAAFNRRYIKAVNATQP